MEKRQEHRSRIIYIILIIYACMGLASCNVDKYVQGDQRVLYKNKIEMSMADSSAVTSEIKDALANA